MKPPGTPPGAPENGIDKEGTGLPGFQTWRGVYLFVLVTFILWVVLLTILTHAFP